MKIISGTFKGINISSPKTLTRPTTGKVKETIFSILSDVRGLDVLDLFAGSGALGFEALSRGAKSATFVDNFKDSISCLKKNEKLLLNAYEKTSPEYIVGEKIEMTINIIFKDLYKFIETTESKFDLIFADPPYKIEEKKIDELLLYIPQILKKNGLFVMERYKKSKTNLEMSKNINLVDLRTIGDNKLFLFKKKIV